MEVNLLGLTKRKFVILGNSKDKTNHSKYSIMTKLGLGFEESYR